MGASSARLLGFTPSLLIVAGAAVFAKHPTSALAFGLACSRSVLRLFGTVVMSGKPCCLAWRSD